MGDAEGGAERSEREDELDEKSAVCLLEGQYRRVRDPAGGDAVRRVPWQGMECSDIRAGMHGSLLAFWIFLHG